MALNFTFNFGRLLAKGERLTNAKINAIVKGITASLAGSVGTTDITDGSVTPAKAAPGAWFYAAATLGGTTYTAAYAPTAVSGYSDGLWLAFKADLANPGASSFNAGPGAKPLRKFGGKALEAGDIKAGQIVTVRYNSALIAGGCWELVAVPGQPLPDSWYFGPGVQTTGTYAVTLPVAPVAYSSGLRIVFQADTANTGAVVVNVNALGAKAVQLNGAALAGNEILIGQMVPMVYDGVAFQILSGVLEPARSTVLGTSKNLVAKNNVGTPNTKIDLSADELVVKNLSGNVRLLSALAVTIDAGTVGANGLDAGGLANTTTYYVWGIWNGATQAGLLSTSATAPTMPAGYTHKALVANCLTDSSAHITTFYTASGSSGSFIGAENTVVVGITGNVAHGLGAVPSHLRWVLVNKTAELGYSIGDEINVESVCIQGAADSQAFQAGCSATNVWLSVRDASFCIYHKTTGAQTNATNADWKAKAYAKL